ncbi:MAG: hypothetical protein ABH950_08850 [Candidatus Altiarchaeota archaeon]
MALKHLFGEKPNPIVLDYFLLNQYWDYSLTDVSRETGISYRTLQKTIPELVSKNLLVHTRTEGKAKLYQINQKNPLVKELKELSRQSDIQYAQKLTEPTPHI